LQDRLEDLEYADDVCLISQSNRDMEDKLLHLREEAEKGGMCINVQKTKELRVGTRNRGSRFIDNKEVEIVEESIYQGSMLSKTGGADTDVNAKINKAKGVFAQLSPIWQSNQ